MYVGTPFRPQPELSRPMEPRDRSLNDPAKAAQAAPVRCATARDTGTNSTPQQSVTMRFRAVVSVSIHRSAAAAGTASLTADRRDGIQQRLQLIDVGRVGPGQDRCQGDGASISDQMVLTPRFGSTCRVRTRLLASAQSTYRRTVNHRTRPINSVTGLQLRQQQLVQSLPHPGRLPIAQSSPAGHAAPASHFLGQVFPANASLEYDNDAEQNLAVIQRLPTRKTKPPRRLRRREQWLDSVPEFLWQYPS